MKDNKLQKKCHLSHLKKNQFLFGFFQKGGVMSESKTFEELLFCLCLDIFQEGGRGGFLIPNWLRNFFA